MVQQFEPYVHRKPNLQHPSCEFEDPRTHCAVGKIFGRTDLDMGDQRTLERAWEFTVAMERARFASFL